MGDLEDVTRVLTPEAMADYGKETVLTSWLLWGRSSEIHLPSFTSSVSPFCLFRFHSSLVQLHVNYLP